MNKVSNEMIEEFNSILETKGSVIRLIKDRDAIDVKLIKDDYLIMENQIINPTKEFYKDLEEFFSNKGLIISYNNTGSCFWSL